MKATGRFTQWMSVRQMGAAALLAYGLTLANIQPSNAADDSVVVSNSVGVAVSSNACVAANGSQNMDSEIVLQSMEPPPVIYVQPLGQAVLVGATARFNVGVDGWPPITYTWRRNGVAIPGATNSTLELPNVQFGDAGHYSVRAATRTGSVWSSNATLTVLTPGGPGSLDLTFDPSAGGTVLGLTRPEICVAALAVQPDGKLIVGGNFTGADGVPRPDLARLNLDGSLDPSFRPPASVRLRYHSDADLAVQPDGKILVVTTTDLVRVNADGSPDPQFHPEGTPEPRGLVLQPDNKIVVRGGDYRSNYVDRLNPDGTRDTTFRRYEPGGYIRAIALQADGKILASPESSPTNTLVRLNVDGTRDASFITTFYGEVFAMAPAANGKIIIGGTFRTVNGQDRPALARLYANGTLDSTFNPSVLNGIYPPNVYAVAVRPDGSVIIGGTRPQLYGSGAGYPGYAMLLKLDAQGNEDTAFTAQLGEITPAYHTLVRALAVWPDGRIAAGGIPLNLFRVLPNGARDTSFQPRLQGPHGFGFNLTLQPGGRAYVRGQFASMAGLPRPGFTRLNANGTLDPSFTPALPPDRWVTAHAVQADGKVVVSAGQNQYSSGDLFRLNADGSFDSSFAPVVQRNNTSAGVAHLLVQPDQRIVIAGNFTTVNGAERPILARLNPDGTLDRSFDPGTDLGVPYGGALALQPDGKILAAGFCLGTSTGRCRALVRLNSDGRVDSSFQLAPGFDELFDGIGSVASILVLPDGRLLVGLSRSTFPEVGPALVRLNADGSLDPTFHLGTGITAGTDVGYINALALQPDGKILVAGAFDSYDGEARPNLVRLNSDGSLDPNFVVPWGHQETGQHPSDIGPIYTMVLQPDGRILIGGWFSSIAGVPRWGMARLLGERSGTNASVALVSPANSAVFLRPAIIPLVARTSGAESRVVHVEFFSGSRSLGQVTTPLAGEANSFQLLWTNMLTGFYQLSATATDHQGNRSTSAPVVVRVVHTIAPPRFTITDLGALEPGGDTYPRAINNAGEVVGSSAANGSYHAFLYRHGQVTDLGVLSGTNSSAAGINDAGVVTGTWRTGDVLQASHHEHIFIYSNGVMRAVPEPPDTRHLQAGGINDSGAVAGTMGCSDGTFRAVVWQQGMLRVLGTLPGGSSSQGLAINDAGQIAGYAAGAGGNLRAVLFAGDDVLDLGLLPEAQGSVALDLNNAGQVVGYSSGAYSLGFVYSNGVMHVLPMLPGAAHLFPSAINNHGQIVGQSVEYADGDFGFDSYDRAVLFRDGVAADLNDLIAATSGWVLEAATDLNDRGQIVGYGRHNGWSRGWLLTPLDRPLVVPGSLDLAFDPTAGGTMPGVGGNPAGLHAILPLPDGKILIGGFFDGVNGEPRSALARLNANGTLDRSFVITGLELSTVTALARQPDGKVLVGGWFSSGPEELHLVRLNPDGSLDSSFHCPLALRTYVTEIVLQPDGKILAGGEFQVIRLNPDGSLDGNFDAGGLQGGEPALQVILLQPDGRILIGGDFTRVQGVTAPGLARLHSDGQFDTSFHPDPNQRWNVTALALQPDGKVLVGGSPGANGNVGPTLVRLNPDGSLDASFSSQPLGDIAVFSVILQPDGRILVGGSFDRGVGAIQGRSVLRLLSDGSLDSTFGPVSAAGYPADTLALQTDGRILIGGIFTEVNGLPRAAIARLNNDLVWPAPFVVRQMSPWHTAIGAAHEIALIAEPRPGTAVYAVEDHPPAGWIIGNITHGGVFDAQTGKVKFGPFFDAEARFLSYSATPPTNATDAQCFTGLASADGADSPVVGRTCLLPLAQHPADTDSLSWSLAVGEITAYGAAWRRGENWPVPPVPIPIDYVTRAAMLWRGGECYEVDAAATNAPLWWVNCDSARNADFQPALSQASDLRVVQRQMAAAFVPGEPLVITVSVSPARARAYAVEDQVPPGWAVTAISHSGEFDAVNGKVKWGPFLDATPRALSYQATPPLSASGVADFAGAGSFDGTGALLAGPRQLPEACRLIVQTSPSGQTQLTLSGRAGARFLLEASTDLATWTPLSTLTNTQGRLEFTDPARSNFSQRFYRAKLLE